MNRYLTVTIMVARVILNIAAPFIAFYIVNPIDFLEWLVFFLTWGLISVGLEFLFGFVIIVFSEMFHK